MDPNWVLTLFSSRNPTVVNITQGRVRQLVRNGRIVEYLLRRYHISESALLAQVRQHHRTSLDDIENAYLERSGQISIVFKVTP